jgi:putative Mn2+ efflux pump MntP
VLVLRILGFLVLITIGCSLLMSVIRKDRRYLKFAWQVLKYALVLVAIVLMFLLLERVVLVI